MNVKRFEDFVSTNWTQPETISEERLASLMFVYTCFAGEAGEVGDALKKVARRKNNEIDVLLEVGDTLHYLTRLVNLLGSNLEEVMVMNINKLEARNKSNPDWLKG